MSSVLADLYSTPKISVLEKILINWATPFEGSVNSIALPLLTNLGIANIRPKYKPFFDKYGVLIGTYKQKVDDYTRLVEYGNAGDRAYSAAIELYKTTPCGWGMICVRHLFREKRNYIQLEPVKQDFS